MPDTAPALKPVANPIWAVVPAAGVGARMQSALPKQYLTMLGTTVLQHSLSALCRHANIAGVMLVADLSDPNCPELVQLHGKPICKAQGGATRAQSVVNGLEMLSAMRLSPHTLIAVHDAARPCLSQADLSAVIRAASEQKNHGSETFVGAILAQPLRETIKQTPSSCEAIVEQTLDRNRLWSAQTPQVFPLRRLLDALRAFPDATDEAQAMEKAGHSVKLVPGSASNLKITVPEDLKLAQFWLQTKE
jgi:2-C-methyl-D-erythritol 4-phosphate cytidylyltransferase